MLYFMVNLPATQGQDKRQVVDKVKSILNQTANVNDLRIPEFKVGTLDSLIVISDELGKMDTIVEQQAVKIVETLKSLVDSQFTNSGTSVGSGASSQSINSILAVNDVSTDQYLMRGFSWNLVKYRNDKSIKDIADNLLAEVNSIDSMIKSKLAQYNTVKNNLANIERKQTGSLAVKNLDSVVRKEQFVQDSEYMTTLLVAVPKQMQKEFLSKYERLANMVVPRSAQKVAEDDEYLLYSVVVFNRVLQEYIQQLKELKFIPREYTYDQARIDADKKELADLSIQNRELKNSLIRLCRVNFGEVFSAWIHLKVLRSFVEGVLRYGLPPNFQIFTVKPINNKMESRVRLILYQNYAYLDPANKNKVSKNGTVDDNLGDESELQGIMLEKDYYPYVNFNIKWDY
ncbi:hypothetical protein MIR68_011219 [Amoeboaphelidium protococcarum]|nr:hypothetical protein MIR68_011219 [Amoeboaphelidium protococcarum]